jgi:FlaA1/EpsC-like NDP-sugar epimerase
MAACVLAAFVFMFTHRLFMTLPPFPDGFVLTATLVVLAGFIVVRYRLRLVTGLADRWTQSRGRRISLGERVLIVGAGEGGEFASWVLSRPDFRKYFLVIGFADDDPGKQGMRYDGVKVLGTTGDIADLVSRYDIGIIIFAISKISSQDSTRILLLCEKTGVPVVNLSDIMENLQHQISRNFYKKTEKQEGESL